MDNLMGHITVGELEEALINLPHGETKLELTYHESIKRIKSQHYNRYQKALRILSWLTYCKRVLFAQELQHALATRPGDKDLDRRFLPELDIIDSLCAGLVVFDQKSGIIRLAHYTTKEYLIDHPDLQNSEAEIAQICVTYLSFGCFSTGRSSNPDEYTHRQQMYPLHHYSAQNWALHAAQALASSLEHAGVLIDLLVEFLDKESNIQAAGQAMMAHSVLGHENRLHAKRLANVPRRLANVPRRLTKVHLVAYGGLSSRISKYINSDEDVEARDSNGTTPLAYAAQNGHLQATELLLQSKRVHPDVQDNCGQTPLWLAAGGGHKEVVEVLLQYGACPEPKIYGGYGPLGEAARIGRVDIMQILLDKGVPIDYLCGNQNGMTPLMLSLRSDNKEAVWFLLDKGANPDFPTGTGNTLLSEAARNGDQELVDYLLKRGVRVEFVDPKGWFGDTPLYLAVERRHSTIVKSLLNAGCNVDFQYLLGKTCLMTAIEYDHEDIAAQLIEHGANMNLQDQSLETALFYAVTKMNEKMVEALLEHGASPNVRNRQEETPLFASARTGDEAILRCLLRKGADPLIQNKHQQTALFLAADHGHASIVGCLIDAGLDVNDQDDRGNTAIFYSAGSGKTDTTKKLLENGANVYHHNVLRETPLFYAARNGILEVSELLLQSHAELDARNILMETPLVHAARGLCSQVVRLFIENGADPNPSYGLASHVQHPDAWKFLLSASTTFQKLKWGNEKPGSRLRFCEAARQIWDSRIKSYSDDEVLGFLKRVVYPSRPHGVDCSTQSWAPLLFAVEGGDAELVRIFLKSGLCIDNSTELVQQVLRQAVDSGHRNIVELMLEEGPDAEVNIPSLVLGVAKKGVAKMGDTGILEFLMTKQEIDLQTKSEALLLAASYGKTEVVRFLLENGAEPTFVSQEARQTALHGAVQNGATELVELLLQQEIDINARDKYGGTPLFYAVENGRTSKSYAVPRDQMAIVQMLLEAGADSNIADDIWGRAPIFFAAGNGNDAIVKLLLDQGAIPDMQDRSGGTPINWAAWRGFEAIVKMLLDRGANANRLDNPSQSPLLWALGKYADGFFRKISRECRVRTWNSHGIGDMEAVVDLLLKNGADPNVTDEDGRTLLSLSVKLGFNSKSLVRSLLRIGCNPNRKDRYGRTPLMGATVQGMTEFVTALLEAPSLDRDATDNFGRTALLEATARNKPRILGLLLQPGAEAQMVHPSTLVNELTELKEGDLICNICWAPESQDLAYHCSICHEGNFDICEECKKWGATCLDGTHEMTKGSTYNFNRG